MEGMEGENSPAAGRTGDPSAAFGMLLDTIRRLRGPEGCAWDRAQSPSTLRASLVEEAWETVSAIEARDRDNLQEELGDLYLLATMISWMEEQEGVFSVSSVLQRIRDKLVRRHPHVFEGAGGNSVKEILLRWDEIKAAEKGAQPGSTSVLDHLPGALPPLSRAFALQKKAAKVGFDWPAAGPVREKIAEELQELADAERSGERERIEEEVGDLLFSVVNLSRFLKVDPAIALHRTNGKFERRFREVERRLETEGIRPADAGLERMDALWNQVKAEEASPPQNSAK